MRIGRKYIPPLVLLMVSISGTAYAMQPFTQHGPGVQIKGIAPLCADLTPSTPAILPGSIGSVVFDCSVAEFGTVPAFTVQSGTITMTPTYTTNPNAAPPNAFPLNPPGYSGCTGLTPESSYTLVGTEVAFCIISPNATPVDFNGSPGTCEFIAKSAIPASDSWIIKSGTPFPFPPGGSWNYCVEYAKATGVGNMPAFDIKWTP